MSLRTETGRRKEGVRVSEREGFKVTFWTSCPNKGVLTKMERIGAHQNVYLILKYHLSTDRTNLRMQ